MKLGGRGQEFSDYKLPAIDVAESETNRKLAGALGLLRRIMEDLNPEEFTFTEVKDEFIEPAGHKRRINTASAKLGLLLEKGLIAESGEKGKYHITDEGRLWYEANPVERN